MHNKKVLIDALKKLGSAKAPSKPRDIITDPMGQWKFPGQNTRIPSNDITMEGVPYPVYAQPNVGPGVMMYPGQDYHFPDADYVDETPQMKAGGALLTKKVTCKKCGWKWDAADGGSDITTCHKCGGQGIVHAQEGGDTDAMNGMMKARLAYANEFGNPAAKRMINLPDNPYQFDNGDIGTHYMASMDNYAVPQIQDEDGQLMLEDYGPESDEAMRFESDEDANYFAKNYKDVSPGFMNIELTPKEIEEYAKGGYIIEDISVPELTKAQKGKTVKPLEITDPKVFAYRNKMYADSLSGYNKTQAVFKALDNLPLNDRGSSNFFNKHTVYSKADDALFKFMNTHSNIKPISWKYTEKYLGIDGPQSFSMRVGIPVFKKPKQPVVFKEISANETVNNIPDPNRKVIGENSITQLDVNGKPVTTIEYVYEDQVPTKQSAVSPTKVVASMVQPKPVMPDKGTAYRTQTVMYPDGTYEFRQVPYWTSGEHNGQTGSKHLNPPGVVNATDLSPEELQTLKNKNKLNSKKEGGALLTQAQKGKTVKPFVVSEKEEKIWEDAYNKKYPPIILNDPNDPRIGWFTKEGNKYIYVPLVKKEILIKPTKNQIVPGKIIRKPGDPNYVPNKKEGGALPKAPGGGQVSKIIKDLSNLTAGKALRTTIYKGVNPANYNVMEKFTGLPSELYRNTVNNSTRPFRTGLSLRFGSPDHLAPFLKDVNMTHTQWNKLPEIDKMNVISAWDNGTLKQINDVGRRRLDAWAVALKQPQEYNTLEQIGDNKYRMLDLDHEPKFFGARHNDIIVNDMKGQEFVGKRDILTGLTKNIYDLEKDPFQLQMNSDDPLANLKRSEFDKLTNNKVLHRPWQQTYHVEPSPNSEFENALYDNDHYGVRGGYRWDVKDTPEGMHWQANDIWDLNPWEKRSTGVLKPHPLTKKYLNANYFKPLQNVEALGLVGGSPFSIENNFIVDPENYKIIKQWEDGGSVDYELGDEIDEATMKRLEKLGYTFEKI